MDATKDARKRAVPEKSLAEVLALHRKAQWRLDFVISENSKGFHAPQEACRLLAEAIDFARQGQISALGRK
jgi:nitrite reductase (cytochrome c-552)